MTTEKESLAAYFDARGLTLVKMIDPVDGGEIVGLDLDQLNRLQDAIMDAEIKVNAVRRYAQDRAGYKRGTVSSLRIASDLDKIVGGVDL